MVFEFMKTNLQNLFNLTEYQQSAQIGQNNSKYLNRVMTQKSGIDNEKEFSI